MSFKIPVHVNKIDEIVEQKAMDETQSGQHFRFKGYHESIRWKILTQRSKCKEEIKKPILIKKTILKSPKNGDA